jgi:hypothetical protein
MFPQENAAPHKAAITHQKLAVLKQPVYLPDLAPLDYYLFPNLKGRTFLSIEEATLAAKRWFASTT